MQGAGERKSVAAWPAHKVKCAYCGNCVSNKGEQVRESLGGYRCLASVSGWRIQHSSGSALLSRGLCLLHFVLLLASLGFG